MLVYLVVNSALGAAKVGIAVEIHGQSRRLKEHQREGWEVHACWNTLESLAHALDVERVVLNGWRDQGLPPALMPNDMPQSGYTETVALADIDLDSTTNLIEQAIARLSNGKWAALSEG